jgi:hypothetical protein
MNAIIAWFNSHKLSSHITMASILSAFGTVFTLYSTIPQFQAECQRINSALPGWAEGLVTAAVAIFLYYQRTSSASSIQGQAQALPGNPAAFNSAVTSSVTIESTQPVPVKTDTTPNITPGLAAQFGIGETQSGRADPQRSLR